MTDKTIVRIAEETTALLRKVLPGENAKNVIPSYNASLVAAQTNHPDNPFLSSLTPIDRSDTAVEASHEDEA